MTRPTTQCNATAPRRQRTFRPQTEGLEERKLLSTAGDLDPTFGSGGSVQVTASTSSKSTPSDTALAVQILSDGKILASGGARTASRWPG